MLGSNEAWSVDRRCRGLVAGQLTKCSSINAARLISSQHRRRCCLCRRRVATFD